ncbi:MAG TPA: pantetheine-phosphate adenylyltransferase [Thermomicrobiales bacterium]|nr:pantetheine-phosphate adenylyltransferase [Thermomicrobiales bacterium]
MKTAIYPGTFDPPTMGHVDVARRAARIFDRLILVIATRQGKAPLFTTEERIALVRAALADVHNVVVDSFSGLTVDYARQVGAVAIVRGLRAVSDFEDEFTLAHMNEAMAPGIETVLFMTSPEYAFVSSSLIKEVASLRGNVDGMVPDGVEAALRRRFATREAAGGAAGA